MTRSLFILNPSIRTQCHWTPRRKPSDTDVVIHHSDLNGHWGRGVCIFLRHILLLRQISALQLSAVCQQAAGPETSVFTCYSEHEVMTTGQQRLWMKICLFNLMYITDDFPDAQCFLEEDTGFVFKNLNLISGFQGYNVIWLHPLSWLPGSGKEAAAFVCVSLRPRGGQALVLVMQRV